MYLIFQAKPKDIIVTRIYCNDYSFNGYNINFTGVMDVKYNKLFCSVDIYIEDLPNKTRFDYEIVHTGRNNEVLKGPFNFQSDIYDDDKKEHKIVTYGDTDAYLKGMKTIDRMKNESYDLLILLGDYAYDIFHDNGQKGDNFWEYMEPVLTKAPFVYTPGNHETIDDGKMLNTRYAMPGVLSNPGIENNFYHFIAGKVLYIQMGMDYTMFTDLSRANYYTEKLYLLLQELESQRGIDYYYIVFFSHRPFYCIQRSQRCMVDLYYSLPIENVLNHFGVDIILNGHVHDFEQSYMYSNYLPVENSENKMMIISGAAGTDKDPLDADRYYNMSFNEEYIPEVNGFTQLKISKENVHVTFFKITDRYPIYEFDLRKIDNFEFDYFLMIGFVILVIIMVIGLAIFLIQFISNDDDKGTELKQDETKDSQLIEIVEDKGVHGS